MSTIDLGAAPAPAPAAPPAVLAALPRRVALTLPELRLAAERASGAPLPFDLATPRPASELDARLGLSRGTAEEQAYAAALAALHDPTETLARRGLLESADPAARLDPGLAGAMGLLATPTVALEIDVCAAGVRLHAWHRRAGDAVATLATVDGLVFELAWFSTDAWAGELARVAVLPEEHALGDSALAHDVVDLPFELASTAAEAQRSGRADLLPVLAGTHAVTGDARPLSRAEVVTALGALTSEAQGRLRVMAADVSGASTSVVGVVSWTLLADGWRALRPHHSGDQLRVEVRRVRAEELAGELAPVLAEVVTGASA